MDKRSSMTIHEDWRKQCFFGSLPGRTPIGAAFREGCFCAITTIFRQVGAGEGDTLRLSGFGTLGYAQDDRRDMAGTRDLRPCLGTRSQTGRSGKWIRARAGVPLEYRIGPIAELVGQVAVREHVEANFNDRNLTG